ncbi:MAG: UvrABC system protein A, partial [Chlamydiae bacterium]|nr:UvrABC system protein A [Chlamydiota bacterium]
MSMRKEPISLKKVRVHNLKGVDLELATNELIVFTGVSGSGKSSMAFDTIYAEGQRRYIESLSVFARRYLGDIAKPDVEFVSGLSPTISIEQKSAGKNPRSTVGTMTEIYDFMRVLFARVGIPHCPVSGEAVAPESKERVMKKLQNLPAGTKVMILAPFAQGKKGEFKDDFRSFLRKGFMRARVDGKIVDLNEEISLDKNLTHDIDIVIDRLVVQPESLSRVAEAVMSALEMGSGVLKVLNLSREEETLYSTHAYSPKSGLYYSSLEPHDFSFNSPTGMCPDCHGMGRTLEFDLDLILDADKSIAEDCCLVASSYQTVRHGNIYDNLAELYDFDVNTPWKKLSKKAQKVFLHGTEKKWTKMHFVHPTRNLSWSDYVMWRGVLR